MLAVRGWIVVSVMWTASTLTWARAAALAMRARSRHSSLPRYRRSAVTRRASAFAVIAEPAFPAVVRSRDVNLVVALRAAEPTTLTTETPK
jgi:hypothetical protein